MSIPRTGRRFPRILPLLAAAATAVPLMLLAPAAEGAPAAAPTATAPPVGETVAPRGAVMPVAPILPGDTAIYDGNWAHPDSTYTYTTAAGWLGVVQPDLAHHRVLVRVVNPIARKPVGNRVIPIPAAWTNWGDFYAAPDGSFYLLVGRNNPAQSNAMVVVRVLHYTASWKPAGAANVTAGQYTNGIYSPFDASAPKMVLDGDRLVVHMGTLIYAIAGVHHQTNFTFEVNTKTMRTSSFAALGGDVYSSHSFQQFVGVAGSDLILVDHGDAYPRGIQMGVIANYPAKRVAKTFLVDSFAGAVGDNFTGVEVTGMATGPAGVLLVGTSINQKQFGSAAAQANAYLLFTNPATGAHRMTWLSKLPVGHGYAIGEPRIVPVGANRFAVLFDLSRGANHRLEYRLFDSAGRQLASATLSGVDFQPITQPIALGTTVYWVAGSSVAGRGYVVGLNTAKPGAPTLG